MAITALHTAATGMHALETKIDVIANNIANADTVGYKPLRTNFQDLFYQVLEQPGVQTSADTFSPLGTQVGLGVDVANTQIIFQQGSAWSTGNPLDAMITGEGFFQVDLPGGGVGYTRAGNFVRNPLDGTLVMGNSEGYRLRNSPSIPEDVPNTAISFTADGRVVATVNGEPQDLGQLQLARFVNPSGLLALGNNVYLASPASGEAIEGLPGDPGFGTINPGSLELSAVEAVTELVELIKTQRVFQMNSQTIQAADEALQVVAHLRR